MCYGSAFISRDLDLWAYANDVTLDFSRPGKPTDNGFIEAFNSKLRGECLNAHRFPTLADAREKMEAWRRDYNEVRPHSAIGYNAPIDIHKPGGATSPSPGLKAENSGSGWSEVGWRSINPRILPKSGGELGLSSPRNFALKLRLFKLHTLRHPGRSEPSSTRQRPQEDHSWYDLPGEPG